MIGARGEARVVQRAAVKIDCDGRLDRQNESASDI